MKVTEVAARALQQADYEIIWPTGRRDCIYFEGSTLMGSVNEFSDIEELLARWREEQQGFLTRNASRIRSSGSKAWNLYCVFLTAEECLEQRRASVVAIEEDFQGTRKIVGTGLLSKFDVTRALLPLLPLQNLVKIAEEDVREDLRSRLSLPEEVKAALFRDTKPKDIARIMLETT